jgi:host factor-I protein
LQHLKENEVPITMFLVNGFQYQGLIRDFDKFTVSVEADGQSYLIFKKMVSTIQTSAPLPIKLEE